MCVCPTPSRATPVRRLRTTLALSEAMGSSAGDSGAPMPVPPVPRPELPMNVGREQIRAARAVGRIRRPLPVHQFDARIGFLQHQFEAIEELAVPRQERGVVVLRCAHVDLLLLRPVVVAGEQREFGRRGHLDVRIAQALALRGGRAGRVEARLGDLGAHQPIGAAHGRDTHRPSPSATSDPPTPFDQYTCSCSVPADADAPRLRTRT